MLNDLTGPMRMGLSAFESDDRAEIAMNEDAPKITVVYEGRLLAHDMWETGADPARDPVQIIDYVPVCTARRRAAVDG